MVTGTFSLLPPKPPLKPGAYLCHRLTLSHTHARKELKAFVSIVRKEDNEESPILTPVDFQRHPSERQPLHTPFRGAALPS